MRALRSQPAARERTSPVGSDPIHAVLERATGLALEGVTPRGPAETGYHERGFTTNHPLPAQASAWQRDIDVPGGRVAL